MSVRAQGLLMLRISCQVLANTMLINPHGTNPTLIPLHFSSATAHIHTWALYCLHRENIIPENDDKHIVPPSGALLEQSRDASSLTRLVKQLRAALRLC